MGNSKRYNSVPVKDNCALCHLNFSPADSRCQGNEFWEKIDYNSTPVKDNCALFAPTPYFRAWVI